MTDILVIPDVHCHPDYDNERLDWLGKYIVDTRPEEVICLGDFADMPSLCSYEKGKARFEGRRYEKDIAAANDGMATLLSPLRDLQARQRQGKARLYNPVLNMLNGNHEHRIHLAGERESVLKETLTFDDLGYEEWGWEVTPFKTILQRHGVLWSHYFTSGTMGRPIGGINPARSIMSKYHTSAVAGHAHVLDFSTVGLPGGRRIFGLVAGCYVHLDAKEEWNADTAHMYWNGVVRVQGLVDGDFSRMEFVRQEELRSAYH